MVGGAPSQVGRCWWPGRRATESQEQPLAAATAAAAAMHVRNYVVTSLVATSSRYLFMGMACEGSGRNRHVRKASTTLAASCCLGLLLLPPEPTRLPAARTLLLINCIARDTNQPMKAMIGQGWRHRLISARPRHRHCPRVRAHVQSTCTIPLAPHLRVPMAHSARIRHPFERATTRTHAVNASAASKHLLPP